jgi:hypothetical protein
MHPRSRRPTRGERRRIAIGTGTAIVAAVRTATASAFAGRTRGLAPLAGVLLLALTVGVATATAGAVLALDTPDGTLPRASLSLDVEDRTVSITHHGGDALDVRRLRVTVAVDGEPLAHQPSVPFFSARGFQSGPTGPFNSATDPRWTAGETAAFRVAGTNRPTLADGTVVTVRLFSRDALVARLRATAG